MMIDIGKRGLRVAALLIAVAATGCTTNQFKEPVMSFNSSVETTQDLVTKYDAVTDDASTRADILLLRQSSDRISFNPADCRIGATQSCYVLNETSGRILGADDPDKAADDAAKLLKTYSQNLTSVVNADTRGDLDKSAEKLETSISALAEKLNAGTRLQESINPITALFKFVAGNYLEYKRFKILRAAIDQANEPVVRLSELLAEKIHAKQIGAMSVQAVAIQDLIATLPDGHRPPEACSGSSAKQRRVAIARGKESGECASYELRELARLSGLTRAVQSAAALRAMGGTDAGAAVRKLGDAHEALKKAVDEPGAGIDTSEKALEAFGKEVRDAYDAVNKLTK